MKYMLCFALFAIILNIPTFDTATVTEGGDITLTSSEIYSSVSTTPNTEDVSHCPEKVACERLSGDCLDCDLQYTCRYGDLLNATCRAKPLVDCTGERQFKRAYKCEYCYQTERWQHVCSNSTDCRVITTPQERYLANCTVRPEILCLGNRQFPRMLRCNWTSGKRWFSALMLSISLGGFGADRFYLGHWRAGIGKLFSFGGLGVWTIVDVVLVASGYVGPADNSLYIF